MITLIDIIRNLTIALEKIFPGIEVSDRDITEGFARPGVYIDCESSKAESKGLYFGDAYEMTIYYFASDRHKGFLDLLDAQSKLRYWANDGIKLDIADTFFIWLDDIEFIINKKDKSLKMDFYITTVQDDDRPDETPYAEELEIETRFES